jgi:hypothetical protein
MARLGDFGTKHERPADQPEEMVTFGWFGAEIRLTQHFNQVRLMNLMDAARTVDREDPMALVVVKDTLKLMIHPGDFGLFWSLAESEDQDLEDLAKIVQVIFESMVRRPTQPLPDSSPGQRETVSSSPDDSGTQVSRGRPDLQQILDQGKETQEKLKAAAEGTA